MPIIAVYYRHKRNKTNNRKGDHYMTTCRKPARRAYYVRYPRGFANEYDLRYTVGGADLPAGDGWERITRREAERLNDEVRKA